MVISLTNPLIPVTKNHRKTSIRRPKSSITSPWLFPKLGQQEPVGEKSIHTQDAALLDPLLLLNPFSFFPLVIAALERGRTQERREETCWRGGARTGGGRSADGEGKCLLELGDVGLLMLMVGWLGL